MAVLLPLVCTLQAAAAATDGLKATSSSHFELVYADHATGAAQDLSVWSAATTGGWSYAGHTAMSGYSAPTTGLLALRAGSDPSALAPPVSMAMHWTNALPGGSTKGGEKVGVFTPVCGEGYHSLGSVALQPHTGPLAKPSDFPGLVCVSDKYTRPARAAPKPVWTSKPTHFTHAGAIFEMEALKTAAGPEVLSPMVAGGPLLYSPPPAHSLYELDPSKVSWVAPPPPPPPPPAKPVAVEAVHLALGPTVGTMTVSWSTISRAATSSSVVKYGTAPSSLTSTAQGDARNFTADPGRLWQTHVANMTGLQQGQIYYYQVGSDNHWSQTFQFKAATEEPPTPGKPELHVIFGDMGASHAYSLCSDCGSSAVCNCTNQTLGVVSERDANMILHLGDFAYNMDTDKGVNGDIFMRNIEQVGLCSCCLFLCGWWALLCGRGFRGFASGCCYTECVTTLNAPH
jgi:hypothetical protein